MRSKARSREKSEAPVLWRDGIHLSGTSIWCDAKRSQDICFVSTAGALSSAKHGQLIASPQTLQILDKPGEESASQLAVPFGQPFTLGTQRIELFSSGHAWGSASLLVHKEETRIVYAGAIHPGGSRLGDEIDHRNSDVLVVSARYGEPRYSFNDTDEVADKLIAHTQEICESQGTVFLLVENIGKAIELASLLQDSDIALSAHRDFYTSLRRLHKNGFALQSIKTWNVKTKSGAVVLWPLQRCTSIPQFEAPHTSHTLLVSGRSLMDESLQKTGADKAFAWSSQADFNELVTYIESSQAQKVYVTHCSDRGAALSDALPSIAIQSIGPPEQLLLF